MIATQFEGEGLGRLPDLINIVKISFRLCYGVMVGQNGNRKTSWETIAVMHGSHNCS